MNYDSNVCYICLKKYDDCKTFNLPFCNHKFCKICIEEWLKISTNCPVSECEQKNYNYEVLFNERILSFQTFCNKCRSLMKSCYESQKLFTFSQIIILNKRELCQECFEKNKMTNFDY